MKNLEEKQLQMQKDAIKELETRIEELQKAIDEEKKPNLRSQSYSTAKVLLPWFDRLRKKIDIFRIAKMQKIIGRIIRNDEEFFRRCLDVDYKNLDDAIAKPLAIQITCRKDPDSGVDAFEVLRKSKKDFEEMEQEYLKQRWRETLEAIKKILSTENEIYQELKKDKGGTIGEAPQRAALAIWPLKSETVCSVVITELLSLTYRDRAESDENSSRRVEVSDRIGGRLSELLHLYHGKRELELCDEELNRYIGEAPLWSFRLEYDIGNKLCDLAIEAGVIEESVETTIDNYPTFSLSGEILKKIKKARKKELNNLSMLYKPMIVEPRPWKGVGGGGFLSGEGVDRRFRLDLIKSNNTKEYAVYAKKVIPAEILEAINTLQRVPFRINEEIFNVLDHYRQKIRDLKKKNRVEFDYYRALHEIVSRNLYDKPPYEIEEALLKLDHKRYGRRGKATKKTKRWVHKALGDIGNQSDPERLKYDIAIWYSLAKYKNSLDTIMEIADEMRDYERFFFVWRMDFRGRIYPQQTLLHPQSGDIPKSLLLFAKRRPLGESGLRWFMIHGANVYGEVDKRPFDERIAWIEKHEKEIVASAEDFENTIFWKQADDPFKFLAFCFEYARYKKDPENFLTSLPIAIDGSNNGFQHISTLLRDSEGARRVNVLPAYDDNDKTMIVSDIYKDVAERLKENLEKRVKSLQKTMQERAEDYKKDNGIVRKRSFCYEIEYEYYADLLAEVLESIEADKLKGNGYFLSRIFEEKKIKDFSLLTKNDLAKYEKWANKLEKKVKAELDEPEDIREELIDRLRSAKRRAKRKLKRGEIEKKNEKVVRREERWEVVSESIFQHLLELDLIDRSFVKKPVMTESYGSSTAGKAEKVLETMQERGIFEDLPYDDRKKISMELAKEIEIAIDQVSKSAENYNNAMKKIARKIAESRKPYEEYEKELHSDNNPFCQFEEVPPLKKEKKKEIERIIVRRCAPRWHTPLGFEVEQVEYKSDERKISIMNDRKVTVRIYNDTYDTKAHIRGMVPNFIHSLDATHLYMTINHLRKKGIYDLITVHDSFATHAADIEELSRILRESFIELHSKPILENLIKELEENFDVDLSDVSFKNIDKDGFELTEVRESLYFFA